MPVATPIRTARLTLIPATSAHVEAELAGSAAFAALMGAVVPASWPPGEYDEGAQRYFLECLTAAGAAGDGWYGWYAVRTADAENPATIVAGGGYFGPPSAAGLVEIGYSVCPEWQRHGYAAELASALAAHAMRQPGVARVQAQTTAENVKSVRVLERSGFVSIGIGTEPGTVRFDFVAPAHSPNLHPAARAWLDPAAP
ncbi:MAG: GNAT family N-acetyltransferase [Gemmatimonadota bacterium]